MDKMMKSATRWMLCLLVPTLIAYAALPQWRSVALGLALGLLASAMNAFLLQRRVVMSTESAVQQEGTRTRRKGLGFGNRIATVLLLAMFGYRYPDIINLPAALVGSMVMPFLILVAAFIHTVKENNSGKG
ncbi:MULTISPECIES: ATP synthase subunit I [Paenibacillus]|uniref:ATP synthase subunit I n=1 Tax=Paenibacillus TaxID=44249 RepID=UPI00203B0816|nr:ATP synthase subunit I [Paenibacillus camelliae]MCM3635262.1 ATP synthase subunit I [Paenibacillus camelliae]